MKKNRNIVLLLFLSLMLTNCGEQYLEEEPFDFISDSNFFLKESDAISATAGVIHPISGNQYYRDYLYATDMTTDIAGARNEATNFVGEIDQFRWQSNNQVWKNIWDRNFNVVNRANRVLEALKESEIENKELYIAYCKFFKARSLFDLVQGFGKIPLASKATVSVGDNIGLPRADEEDVYLEIINLLEEANALDVLQVVSNDNGGLPSAGAVKTLLAKVLITRGYRTDWGGDNADFTEAVRLLEEVMTMGYALEPNYDDIFRVNNKNNSEIIFSHYYQDNVNLGNRLQQFWAAPHNKVQNGFRVAHVTRDFYDRNPSHYRIDATCPPWPYFSPVTGQRQNNQNKIPNTLVREVADFAGKYLGENNVDGGGDGSVRTSDNNFILLRYSDVLLSYLEARNQLGSVDQSVLDMTINQVRARARSEWAGRRGTEEFLNAGEASRVLISDGNAPDNPAINTLPDITMADIGQLQDIILEERAMEFIAEGHRRWDLLRTGKYLELMSVSTDRGHQDAFAGGGGERFLLLPIPQAELEVNPTWSQNPGH